MKPFIRAASSIRKIRTSGPFWIVSAAVWALTACAASAVEVDYSVVDQGTHSGRRSPSPAFDLITDEAEFEKLMKELYSDRIPSPSPPEIDFQTSMVVFISLGEKPTAGYRVAVDEVTRSRELLKVKIEIEEPSPDRFQAAVMTRPFVLIKIKKEPGLKRGALVDAEGQVIRSFSIP